MGEYKFIAHWHDGAGCEWSAEFTTGREAIECIVKRAQDRDQRVRVVFDDFLLTSASEEDP